LFINQILIVRENEYPGDAIRKCEGGKNPEIWVDVLFEVDERNPFFIMNLRNHLPITYNLND
jgi:hypothetical protein